MDEEDFSAPPAIELQLKEDDNNIDSLPPGIVPEEEQKMNDEQNNVTIGNNNEEKKEETKHEEQEEEEEEEEEEIQRPLFRNFVYEIGTARKVLQSIATSLIYGFAIWGLTLQIIYGINYGFIDVGILLAFATFMLIFTIKKRTTGGCKFGAMTMAVIFLGAVPNIVNFFFTRNFSMFLIYFLVKTIVLMLFIAPLNCNQ